MLTDVARRDQRAESPLPLPCPCAACATSIAIASGHEKVPAGAGPAGKTGVSRFSSFSIVHTGPHFRRSLSAPEHDRDPQFFSEIFPEGPASAFGSIRAPASATHARGHGLVPAFPEGPAAGVGLFTRRYRPAMLGRAGTRPPTFRTQETGRLSAEGGLIGMLQRSAKMHPEADVQGSCGSP